MRVSLALPLAIFALSAVAATGQAADYAPVLANPDSTATARLPAPGQAVVSSAAGSKSYAIPPQCYPQALSTDTLFACTSATAGAGGVVMVNLDTGAASTLAVDPFDGFGPSQDFQPSAAGSSWVSGTTLVPPSGTVPTIVSRTDGSVLDTSGELTPATHAWGARRYVNLDTATPDQKLCSPVKRSLNGGGAGYLALTRVGQWTLREEPNKVGLTENILQRCGSTKTINLGVDANAVLGRGYVAYRHGYHQVRLRDLDNLKASPRKFTTTTEEPATLAFSSDHLYISTTATGQPWTVRAVRLG